MPWAPDYLTVAEAKAWLQISDAVDDDELAVWCTTASRAIDTRCNRQFGKVATPTEVVYEEAPYYVPAYGRWLLDIDDLMDATGLEIAGTAYEEQTAAALWPRDAAMKGKPWTALAWTTEPYFGPAGTGLAVTAAWGWSSVPVQVAGAARLQVARFHARRASPLGVAGSPSEGSELRLLARLDPDVAVSLAGLSRPRRMG